MIEVTVSDSRGFGDLAGTDATSAHLHVLGLAVDHRADALDIRQPPPLRHVVGVGDIAPSHRALAADFTSLRHSNSSSRTPNGVELNNTGGLVFQVGFRVAHKKTSHQWALSGQREVQ